jgi:tetraacyldisaccharide 4'-kinase
LGILSAIYRTGLSCRKLLYKSGLKKSKKLPVKVISIGNITLGGTGKTPAVIASALEAKTRGFKPCILTRGYKGKTRPPCLTDSKTKEFLETRQTGDETVLMAESLRDVPIVKGKNRFLSGAYALGGLGPDSINVFILDDGFQHWSLYRDVDVILIDASNPFGNEKLFPEGILREPIESLSRADIIVITKSDMVDEESISSIKQRIKQYNPEAPIYTARHKPVSLINISGETRSLDWLSNKNIYAFAGIANIRYFKFMLKTLGANIIKFKKFRDHYFYSQNDLKKIKKESEGLEIVTTEKDLVKLRELDVPGNISALKIEFSIDKDFYNHLFGTKEG